jgi:hypothetical protein
VIITDSTARQGGWLRRLRGAPDSDPALMEEPSLFEAVVLESAGDPVAVADIPVALRHEVQDTAVRETFRRLQETLRALLAASMPDAKPLSLAEYLSLFHHCRHALEREIFLTADAYPGAVRTYSAEFERDYVVHGRCQVGEPVRIVVPCWRLRGEVVVRGEAEPMSP